MIIVHEPKDALAVTHGGTFHCDEVMATAILELYLMFHFDGSGENQELTVCRVGRYDPAINAKYVYDIGGGKWDHHQRGGNGSRDNGVPYSSCGLIWRDLGLQLCNYRTDVWEIVDREVIQPIDAVDCGTMPKMDYPTQHLTLSSIISSFNPNWDESIDLDKAFADAVEYAEKAFAALLARAFSRSKGVDEVTKIIDTTEIPEILVLDRYLPWIEVILNPPDGYAEAAKKVLVGVYPAHRGGYQWRTVPDSVGSYGMRVPAPTAWWGQSGQVLQEITGVPTATFCHPNGFIGGATTRDGAIEMAKLLVARKEGL